MAEQSDTVTHILCDACRVWRVCSAEYEASVTHQNENCEWFCCQHPDLENCSSRKRSGDKKEQRKQPAIHTVKKWFEQAWPHLYIFAKINHIGDYKLDSWSPFLKETNPNYLLTYIRVKNPFVCPHGDGKFKFFSLLSKWLTFHDQWLNGMMLFRINT